MTFNLSHYLFLHKMEQHNNNVIFGGLLGATSLLAGYLLHKISQSRSQELSYLQGVPQFTDIKKLRSYLSNSPNNSCEVLVEGVVKKQGSDSLRSENAGLEGAARLLTTTTYKKVFHESSNSWNDSSSTIENVCASVPFALTDRQGNSLTVESVKNAGGFRQILERVWQDRVNPDSRSLGDYATNMIVSEIPNGSLTREYMLVFGSSVGAYGVATLQKSLLSSGAITLMPKEVSSSIHGLISRNEMVVDTLKFFSLVLVLGGGGILLFTAGPYILRAFGYHDQSQRND